MAKSEKHITDLYEEHEQWIQNLGEKTVHAKRMPGKFRKIKWALSSFWLLFFLLPYLELDGRQAILFDIENRQYHIFNTTILPQDIWLLAPVLMFLAILLAVITATIGRAYCGYICFQTVWTDVFTKIEELIEGLPLKRRKLDDAPLSLRKFFIKFTKHITWILLGLLSAITWLLWFGVTWDDFFNFNLSKMAIGITFLITVGVYIFAGIMREQTCLWICPYSRIQGTMTDKETLVPTYDNKRGEKRGRLVKGKVAKDNGDCVDCNLCVAVCPTGVDIRKGQEYGCITCGLCIDACDSVMKKIKRPLGLIKYISLNEFKNNKEIKQFYKRPRVIVYSTILSLALAAIIYGLTQMSLLELKVLHHRQPLFIELSDGSIRNKYELKIVNKKNKPADVTISFNSKIKDLKIKSTSDKFTVSAGSVKSITVYLSAYLKDIPNDDAVYFVVNSNEAKSEYKTRFFSSKNN